jgi:hypothetical protein
LRADASGRRRVEGDAGAARRPEVIAAWLIDQHRAVAAD